MATAADMVPLIGDNHVLVRQGLEVLKNSRKPGVRALLEAARKKEVTEKRIQASLRRIAATKALTQPPLPLDMERFNQLANEIRELNKRLDYVYPGESNVQ